MTEENNNQQIKKVKGSNIGLAIMGGDKKNKTKQANRRTTTKI